MIELNCVVDSEKLYNQLKGMFKLSGVYNDGYFIVLSRVMNNELELVSCFGQPNLSKSLKAVNGVMRPYFNITYVDVFEMYYIECEENEENSSKYVNFVLNTKVLTKLKSMSKNCSTISIISDDKSITFTSGNGKELLNLDAVVVTFANGLKPLHIQKVKGIYRPEYSIDIGFNTFMKLFDKCMSENIYWAHKKNVFESSIYVGKDYVYALRNAFALCFKTKEFSPIVDFIEKIMYSYNVSDNYLGLYRIPCYVIARLRELSYKRDEAYKQVRLTVTHSGACNISLISKDTVVELRVWSWDLNESDTNVNTIKHILSYYNIREGIPNVQLKYSMEKISSGDLRDIARIGLKFNKQMEYGSVVYLNEATGKITLRPSQYARPGTYEDYATIENIYNFPNTAVNTVFLQNIIKVMAGEKKAELLYMGSIEVERCKYKALYLQTLNRDITAVLLPVNIT